MQKKLLKKYLFTKTMLVDHLQAERDAGFLIHAEIREKGTVLQVDVFDSASEKPIYTIFSTSKDFIMWEYEQQRWSEAMLRKRGFFETHYEWDKRARKSNTYLSREYRFDTEESMLCGARFFNRSGVDTIRAVDAHQQSVRAAALEIRHRIKREAIQRVMDQARPLPATFQAWVDRIPLANSRYVYYKRHGNKAHGYCTACGTDVIFPASQAKHNQLGICPHCHSNITFKAVGISKRIQDFVRVEYVQRVDGNSLMIREFDITKYYGEDYRHPKYSQYEGSRHIIRPNGSRKKYLPNGCTYDWLGEWKNKSDSNEYFAWLYTPNLHAVLKGTPWQYSGITEYAKKTQAFAATWYFADSLIHPCVEYLAKMGLSRLLDEKYAQSYFYGNTVNWDGRTISDVLKLSKPLIRIACQDNVNSKALSVLQTLSKAAVMPSSNEMDWFNRNGANNEALAYLLRYMSVHKIQKYTDYVIQKGQGHYQEVGYIMSDWRDYLENAQFLEHNLHRNTVLFPPNLKKSHDSLMKLVKVKEDGIVDRKLGELCQEMMDRYSFANEDYIVRAPSCLKDLILEGERLGHCVAKNGYGTKMAKGQCVILFIRKRSEPDMPFVTVEVRDGHIAQIRAFNDHDPDKNVLDFVEVWKRKVLAIPHRRSA